jgi:phosphate transport system permease protein
VGWLYFGALAVLIVTGYLFGRARAVAAGRKQHLHSRPSYYGAFVAIWILTPMALVYAVGVPVAHKVAETQAVMAYDPALIDRDFEKSAALREIEGVASGQFAGEPSARLRAAAQVYNSYRTWASTLVFVGGVAFGLIGLAMTLRLVSATFRARNYVERFVSRVLLACACVAVLTTIGIVFSVLFESIRFFNRVSPFDFLFGLQWSPQTAIRADQVGSSGAFGIVPLVTGTLLITFIAMLIAGPVGLFAAIYMAEYATPRFRSIAKPILEILAGIPTVVLGFFAALTVAPNLRVAGAWLGLDVASESALAAGIVMGMMIIPFVSSLSDDVINAVPQSMRDGSLAMGATPSETVKKVVLPAALPGIVSAFMLAISRAVGETMIVVMAAGLAANLTFNPLEAVTTFTVQIKTILVGDQEFDSAKTLSAFALGLVLFFFTLMLNVIALEIVKRYREQYD